MYEETSEALKAHISRAEGDSLAEKKGREVRLGGARGVVGASAKRRRVTLAASHTEQQNFKRALKNPADRSVTNFPGFLRPPRPTLARSFIPNRR